MKQKCRCGYNQWIVAWRDDLNEIFIECPKCGDEVLFYAEKKKKIKWK